MRPNDLRRRHRLLQISTWLSSLLATNRYFAAARSGCSPNNRTATGLVLVAFFAPTRSCSPWIEKIPRTGDRVRPRMGMPMVEAGNWSIQCPDGSGLRRENVPTTENSNELAACLCSRLFRYDRLSAPLCGQVPASTAAVACQSAARKAIRNKSWRAALVATVSADQPGKYRGNSSNNTVACRTTRVDGKRAQCHDCNLDLSIS
jgi:hypothetical protein